MIIRKGNELAEITAKDIAKKLGLSPAAVSMALNGKTGVSRNTRERILSEAVKHGYKLPGKTAVGQNDTINFLIYVGVGIASQTTFSTFVLQGVATRANALGYRVMVHYIYEDKPIDEQLSQFMKDTCGVVFLGTDITEKQRDTIGKKLGKPGNIPIVVVDNFLFASYMDCVGNDNLYGAKAAVSYLIRCGHTQIGYLRSKQRIANFEDRELGVKLAIQEHRDLGIKPLQVVDVDIFADIAYTHLVDWASKNKPSTAYFAENDDIAATAIRAFRSCGYKVPQDVSIIGFDNVPVSEMTYPTLTTMHSYKDRIGELAVNMLHEKIGLSGDTGRDIGFSKVAVSMKLIERESVKNKNHEHLIVCS